LPPASHHTTHLPIVALFPSGLLTSLNEGEIYKNNKKMEVTQENAPLKVAFSPHHTLAKRKQRTARYIRRFLATLCQFFFFSLVTSLEAYSAKPSIVPRMILFLIALTQLPCFCSPFFPAPYSWFLKLESFSTFLFSISFFR